MDFSKFGFGGLMQQAQKLKDDMQQMQEKLPTLLVEGVAGANLVKVVMNGKQQVVSLTISPDVLQLQDKTRIEDLIKEATNNAVTASHEVVQKEMSKITGMLGPLAGLLKGS